MFEACKAAKEALKRYTEGLSNWTFTGNLQPLVCCQVDDDYSKQNSKCPVTRSEEALQKLSISM